MNLTIDVCLAFDILIAGLNLNISDALKILLVLTLFKTLTLIV